MRTRERRYASRQRLRRLHVGVVFSVTGAVAMVVGLSSGAVWYAEHDAPERNIRTYWDAVWWSMETITTVGYGDHHPVTTLGRLVAMGLMVIGVALVGVITATVVTWFFSELDVRDDVRHVEEAEVKAEATLEAVLEELQAIRGRLDTIERADDARQPVRAR